MVGLLIPVRFKWNSKQRTSTLGPTFYVGKETMKYSKRWHGFLLKGLICIMAGSVLACVQHRPIQSENPFVQDHIYPKGAKRADGAIWSGDNQNNLLFSDAKAWSLGDIVTILVDENASSSQTATTQTSRDSSINFGVGRLFGLPSNLGIQNFLGMGNGFNPGLDASTRRSLQGEGTTSRDGTLTATITAIVKEILPNGNFRIEGRRSVTVNNEEQILILTGIIRPQDIQFDNTISSRLVADAAITFTGLGVLADEQRPGWAIRIISWVWPF